ncbi:MAG: NFACT RNA binding domain-containing protein [Candidatus Micrarchaeota archaeon]
MPKIRLDSRFNAQQNAARYFEEAKKFKAKAEGARKAIADTEAKLAKVPEFIDIVRPKIRVKAAREKKWFEKFHFFTTSGGFLVVAGKDAKSNELLVARHMEAGDLFMHADITGAPATIIKDGQKAGDGVVKEAAQFSACYSSAWKNGLHSVDVYAALPSQVSKQSHGEYVGKGGFMIYGERRWFRNAQLKLVLAAKEGTPFAAPLLSGVAGVLITPGRKGKKSVAEAIARKLAVPVDSLMPLIPGDSDLKQE